VDPQCARLKPTFTLGVGVRVWPVHASREFLWGTIQSVVPSRRRTEKVVVGDLVAIRAVMGDVEEMRWYRKGIPRKARVKGERRDSVD
jgi:hypothetical protein